MERSSVMATSPQDIRRLGARAIADGLASGRLTARAVTEAHLERIAERESDVRAWKHLDADGARAAADAVDRGSTRGLLAGVPIGVKDVIATADMPTGYGSAAYEGFRPACDAPCVALSRAEGAVVLGKTVSTEFAMASPGPTRNPHDLGRTPGGSSSGSCAAVASDMAVMAFGTQTAGSILRPAAYCGIVGYKPTWGLLDAAEIKVLAMSLDTLGVVTRTVDDAAWCTAALSSRPALARAEAPAAPVVGLFRPSRLDQAGPEALAALEHAASRLSAAGVTVREVTLPDWFDRLHGIHAAIMGWEVTRSLAHERLRLWERLTPVTRAFLLEKAAVTLAEYDAARSEIVAARHAFAAMMDGLDVLMTLPAPGIAPEGLGVTGSPLFNAPWTVLGTPCLTLPVTTHRGLPVGVQLVGRLDDDARLLAVAGRAEAAFDVRFEPTP